MLDRMPRIPGPVPALILVILASLALSQSAAHISRVVGMDFYQFWGVPVAMRLTGHTLGSPYRNGQRYFETLKAYTARVNDAKLKAANGFWGGPDFAGSPLLYTVFTLASNDYTVAVQTFQALQIVLFLGAFLLLGALYRFDPFHLLCLALLCVLFYQPLLSDLRLANLGCFQLIYLTGLLFLGRAIGRAPSFLQRAGLGALFLAALAALTLCKPNVALISALLAAHLGVRHGPRLFVAAALPAALVAALLLILPCLYFGSWTVWREWYDFVYGSNAPMLVRPVADGNFSTAVLLSSWLGLDVYAVSLLLLGLLATSLIVAAGWSSITSAPAASSRGQATVAALRRVFEDARTVLGIGIVLTMAASPLYWLHYYVLLLIPALWLLSAPTRFRFVPALAAGAVLMSSGILEFLFRLLQRPEAIPASIALSWLPLWGALLLHLAFPGALDPAVHHADDPKPRARSATAPSARRRKR
jgi:hypothetical protein